jgi:hypothetical protein
MSSTFILAIGLIALCVIALALAALAKRIHKRTLRAPQPLPTIDPTLLERRL